MTDFHLAQVNVARLVAAIDSPQLAEFVESLEPVNALADASPGFVWRLQTEAGDATSLRIFDDEWLIVNLSVWASIEALRDYVYRTAHAEVLRRRLEWFERRTKPIWLCGGSSRAPSPHSATRRNAYVSSAPRVRPRTRSR